MKTTTRKKKNASYRYDVNDKVDALVNAFLIYRKFKIEADVVRNCCLARRHSCNSGKMPRLDTLEYKIIETECNWGEYVLMLSNYNHDLVNEVVTSFETMDDSAFYFDLMSTLAKYGFTYSWQHSKRCKTP